MKHTLQTNKQPLKAIVVLAFANGSEWQRFTRV